MPDEDQNNGSPMDSPSENNPPNETQQSTDLQTSEPSTPPVETSEQPVEQPTAGDALAAFEAFNKESNASPYQKPAQPPVTKSPGLNSKRIYDGLDEAEKQYFTRMSTDAYNYLYPRHIENKRLQAEYEQLKKQQAEAKDMSLYEQDEAYTLSPEYKEYTQNLNQVNAELAHWQEQLANIEIGNEWYPIVKDTNGNPVIGNPLPSSPQYKAAVINAIAKGHYIVGELTSKINNHQSTFKQKHQGYISNLNSARAKIFEGVDLSKLEAAAKRKIEVFPKYLHNKPEVKILAEALVLLDGYRALLSQQKVHNGVAAVKARTTAAAGPTNERIQSANATADTVGAALDAFKTAKAKGIA